MKIELTNLWDAETASQVRHDGRGEAHVRVLTDEPAGPEIWDKVVSWLREHHLWFAEKYDLKAFEKWFPELTELEEGETDYDGYGHESWFVIAEKRH